MKKLFIVALLLGLCLGPIPSHAEPCTGVVEKTVDINESFGFCWDVLETPDLKHYVVVKDGVVIDAVLLDSCADDSCFSPDYKEGIPGTYSFSIRAVDLGDHQSDDSNPVTLHVVDLPPPAPSGCSFR